MFGFFDDFKTKIKKKQLTATTTTRSRKWPPLYAAAYYDAFADAFIYGVGYMVDISSGPHARRSGV